MNITISCNHPCHIKIDDCGKIETLDTVACANGTTIELGDGIVIQTANMGNGVGHVFDGKLDYRITIGTLVTTKETDR